MKKTFKPFANYISLYDGVGKPRIDFQHMYKLFPHLTFTATKEFGQYENFGEAFEHKKLNMIVSDNAGNECYMYYREYMDTNENSAYVA